VCLVRKSRHSPGVVLRAVKLGGGGVIGIKSVQAHSKKFLHLSSPIHARGEAASVSNKP
jgi:hypothetical protein